MTGTGSNGIQRGVHGQQNDSGKGLLSVSEEKGLLRVLIIHC